MIEDTLLTEIAWEACNQVGGIYTVLRSKVPTIVEKFGGNYCLIGPYVSTSVSTEFEEIKEIEGPFSRAAAKMREMGFDARYGKWLVTGRPKIVLLNPNSVMDKLSEIKYGLWEHHHITTPDDHLVNQVVAFGFLTRIFMEVLAGRKTKDQNIIAHFHEWMAGTPIPDIRKAKLPISITFTTHATILGRYLAMNDPEFYNHLPFFDWLQEARNFNIESQVLIERAAAHGAHVFTTVSEVTAMECQYLLGREPDIVTPNGINIERFHALHEFQNLHEKYKDRIHQFVMAHFFGSYTFDLDKTLYFFTSGRFEFRNKGFGLTLEALARLNYMMQKEHINKTVVMFFITKQPYHSVNPDVLQNKAIMEELRKTCQAIERQVGSRLFHAAASIPDNKLTSLSDYVDDYWKLRFRRTLQSWKSDRLPPVVTHNLVNDTDDPILMFLRSSNLVNKESDRVKIVYHPDFIVPTNPLWGIEYDQFTRGCNLGVFPSYYEPWGYTPLESIARGVPAVTSNLSGFGDFVVHNIPNPEEKGIVVIDKVKNTFHESAQQLANDMLRFVKQNRRERAEMRNKSEAASVSFDWDILTKYYDKAYLLSIQRGS
ncbi:MAG: glycosyltransferase [Cyclobacteriaceae bacterium]|nr:glycosyltransferase [Cyclobacteriaceae bacterium]